MTHDDETPRRGWFDLLLLLGAVAFFGLVARSAIHTADVKADVAMVSDEARKIHDALSRYHKQNGSYPGTAGDAFLDRLSLSPLTDRGYYKGSVLTRIVDRQVDAYAAGDAGGHNAEFWLEMSLRRDPSVRFLVARSDDAPLGGGEWRDGAFVYRGGVLEPL